MAEPTGAALDRTIEYVDDTRYLAREFSDFRSIQVIHSSFLSLVVGLTILVYDALLTFPNELYFVWLSPDRETSVTTRIAYTMNRYGTIVMSVLFLNGERLRSFSRYMSDYPQYCFQVLRTVQHG